MRKKNSYHPIYLLSANVRTLLPISGVVQPVKFTAILTKTHFRYKIRIIHGTQEGYKFPEKKKKKRLMMVHGEANSRSQNEENFHQL